MERINVMTLAWRIYKAVKYRFKHFYYSLKLAWSICKSTAIFKNGKEIIIKSKSIPKLFIYDESTKRKASFQDDDRNWEILSYALMHN